MFSFFKWFLSNIFNIIIRILVSLSLSKILLHRKEICNNLLQGTQNTNFYYLEQTKCQMQLMDSITKRWLLTFSNSTFKKPSNIGVIISFILKVQKHAAGTYIILSYPKKYTVQL